MSSTFNKKIFKVLSFNAVATLVKMLTGFVSIKVVAVLIGPAGVAMLGQLTNFSSIFLTVSTGGISNGITKYIAENADSETKVRPYLVTAFWIVTSLSVVTGLTLILGSGYFSNLLFNDLKYRIVLLIFGFTIIFYSLNNLLVSVINGFKQFKAFVIINIAGSLVSLLFTIILAYRFGLTGALIAAVTFQSLVFIVTLYKCYQNVWFRKENFIGKFDWVAGKKLFHYSIMTLVTAATVPISQLFVRGKMASEVSITSAGVWEGMNRVSGMYLMVITTSLGIYYLPRLSEIKQKAELRKEIMSIYKMFVPALLLLTVIIYFGRDIIIAILFTSDFKAMSNLFLYQLIGDFFKLCSWFLSFVMIAKSMTLQFITTEIIFAGTFTLLALFFINRSGSLGATIAYAINYFVYFVTMVILFRKLLFTKSAE